MSRYDRSYGTDWDELGKDEAIERAYALGVAAALGDYHPDELEAIREEMTSAYDQSVVDLAFEEGKNEGKELDPPGAGDEAGAIWSQLVEGETVAVDEEELPTGGRDGLPDAIDKIDALDRPNLDRTEATDLPDCLKRD